MIKNKGKIILACTFTVLTLCMIGFIFFQSTLPAVDSSRESGRVVTFLNKITVFFGFGEMFTQNFVRKCAHLTEFAALGTLASLTFLSYKLKWKTSLALAPVLSFVVAVIDESLQLFSEGRSFQITDICIDTAGGIISAVFLLLIFIIFVNKNKRMKKSND